MVYMRIDEMMTREVLTIGPNEPASTAWSRMERERVRHLVVLDGGRLVGVLSERDLGGRSGDAVRRDRSVSELMTRSIATVEPGTTLRQAANLMRGRLIGSLPVVENGRVIGIVTATDVLEELGRGSTRPAVTARRRSMRLAPAGARSAARRAVDRNTRAKRPTKRAKNAGRTVVTRSDGSAAAHTPTPTSRITPALGRRLARQPDGARRTPMSANIARPLKSTAGRTTAGDTPAYVRSVGTAVDAADQAYLRRKLGMKLGKFAPSIERVSARIDDVNGPRGGVDKRCRIKVVLSGLPSVLVEEQHHTLPAAMDRALDRTETAVRRSLQRRRTVSVRHRLPDALAA
jgi:CBS domain-containing protein